MLQAESTQFTNFGSEIGPPQSLDRSRQFCDHLGVTDCYTAYRNNPIGRPKNPITIGFQWSEKNVQNQYNTSLNVGWKPPKNTPNRSSYDSRVAASAPAYDRSCRPTNFDQSMLRRSIQERCGINTRFPGRTEYMDRYSAPPTGLRTQDYLVNPLPNYRMHGRDLGQPQLYTGFTEYQTRYQYPDGSTLVRLPWLRK